MTSFAVVAFFQITFIPGFLFLKAFGLKRTGVFGTIIYSFGLSLLINYLMVYHLTLVGLYTPLASYIILIAELVFAIILVFKKKLIIIDKLHLELSPGIRSFPWNILPLLSIVLIIGSLYFFFSSYIGVFTHWDAVFSWNRWAIDWHLNDIPVLTYLYPQLIPTNWSLSYVMVQDHTLQFAAKSVMPLFAIFIPIVLFDLYLKKKKIAFILSILVFFVLVSLYCISYIDSGYVDFASAFLSVAALHAILVGDTSKPERKNIIMVVLLSSAAAATKQAGFIILVFAIIWFAWLMIRNRKVQASQNILKNILWVISIILITLYWYIVKVIDIALGRDFSTLRFLLIDIHHAASLPQRFVNGLEILRASPFFLMAIVIISLASFFDRKSRWFTLGITIPSFLIWGFFFSYDDRNIIMTFPFLSWSASSGFMLLMEKIKLDRLAHSLSIWSKEFFRKRSLLRIKLWPKQVFFLLIFSLVLGLIFLVGSFSEVIKDSQIQKQRQLGDSSLNKMIYDYLDNNGIDGKIITDYYWVTALPGFEDASNRIFLENDKFIILSNSDSYTLIDPNTLVDEDTFGFLISDMYFRDNSMQAIFRSKMTNKEYAKEFSKNGYHFIIINK